MRCPDCNKFVPYGDPETDVQTEEAHNDGSFEISATVTLPCEECGTELKQTEVTFEGETVCPGCEANLAARATEETEPVTEETEPVTEDEIEHDFSIENVEVTVEVEERPMVGKRGQQLKTTQTVYMVTFLVNFKCNLCGQEWNETETVELTSGDFDEVC